MRGRVVLDPSRFDLTPPGPIRFHSQSGGSSSRFLPVTELNSSQATPIAIDKMVAMLTTAASMAHTGSAFMPAIIPAEAKTSLVTGNIKGPQPNFR